MKKPLPARDGDTNVKWLRERAAAIRAGVKPTQRVHWDALSGGLDMIANYIEKLERITVGAVATSLNLSNQQKAD